MRRIVIGIVVGVLAFVGLGGQAFAASNNDNPIWSGLWSGVNAASGGSAPTKQQHVYAALGDSVAAGLGLPASSKATARDKQCGRSPYAYPNRVALALKMPIINASCSGATAGDLFTDQGVSGPNIPPQLDAAFSTGTPELITITAGANDAHWRAFLQACYTTNCANSASTTAANAYLVSLQLKLYYMFYSIQSRSGNSAPPKVIITGYYNPLSAACESNRITPAEITWLNAESTALNQTIQNVTSHFTFATYVPISFKGHDVCSSSPWVQGQKGKAPFHPTATGQKAMTQAILNKLR